MSQQPLKGLVILEFCQYLSGPSAGLRLADLGARVIKIESPNGDACRKLAIEDLWVDQDSLLFHTINRNKESYTANLKDSLDLDKIKKLIRKADVMIHNFRPGVMTKLGLDYEAAKLINESIVYAEVTGYGAEGPWSKKPGQDLLLQARSGLMYTSGTQSDPPVPFGLAIGDIICGAQLVQGVLAALIRVKKTGKGAKLELSLLESLLDFQFELLTTYHTSGKLPQRSESHGGHALLGAPYGIYETADGHIAIAMVPLKSLGSALDAQELMSYDQSDAFAKRDEIKGVLADLLKTRSSEYWLDRLRKADLWAMPLTNWQELVSSPGYKAQQMEQVVSGDLKTTRCPIRINGERIYGKQSAPQLGADNRKIEKEFGLV
ncbi:MAG: CaiB/BaiF CoA-transferase family protein [Marinoscillum sp.]